MAPFVLIQGLRQIEGEEGRQEHLELLGCAAAATAGREDRKQFLQVVWTEGALAQRVPSPRRVEDGDDPLHADG